jgi:hypothetical protein
MKVLALLALALLSGCASMHGCDMSVGAMGPRWHCDQAPAAPAAAPAATPVAPASTKS